jgi:hypothetical protein
MGPSSTEDTREPITATIGATIIYNVPALAAAHGNPAVAAFQAPAIVLTGGKAGSCSLTYFDRNGAHYVNSVMQGEGSGLWQPTE